jgi:putative membrane protein
MDDSAPIADPTPAAAASVSRVSLGRLLITLAGLGLGAYLVIGQGWSDILRALKSVGLPGLGAITLFHALPTLLCGLAWWLLLRPSLQDSWLRYFWLRWIRDGTDGVVPILPVSGELIATRILKLRGIPFAGAGIVVDVTAELFGQLLFAILGLLLLVADRPAPHELAWVALGIGVMTVQFGGFFIAQKKGLFRLIERPFEWIRRRRGHGPRPACAPSAADRTLHDQILQIHAHRRVFLQCVLLHLIAWVVGAMEAWIGLRLMGHALGIGRVLVIESLVTASRSITFFVPLNAGVQEGAYVLVGSLVGLHAGPALAVSLLKRARDLIKGVPAVMVWQYIERREVRRAPGRPVGGRPA